MTEQVLAGGYAARDGEGHLALVCDQGVDGPLTSGRVVAVLVDLEPLQAVHVALRRVGHLCAVDARHTFSAKVGRPAEVAGRAGAALTGK